MTAAKVHGIVVHGQCGNASYTRFSISSDIDLALGEDCLSYCKTLSDALPVCGSSPLRSLAPLLGRKGRFD